MQAPDPNDPEELAMKDLESLQEQEQELLAEQEQHRFELALLQEQLDLNRARQQALLSEWVKA